MFTLSAHKPLTEPLTIRCADGEFTLLCQRPTYDQLLEDEGLAIRFYGSRTPGEDYSVQMRTRLQTVVRGWEGVVDAGGAEIPYSGQHLARLLSQHPAALAQVLAGVSRLYTIEETAVKESVASPAASGDAAPATIPPTP